MIFDLDGVLLDSEQLWDRARRDTVDEQHGHWPLGATEAMQGMSSTEWASYLKENADLSLSNDEIIAAVVGKLLGYYRQGLPLIPGAVEAVKRVAGRWPLGLASSSNREVIDLVLDLSAMRPLFAVTVSSEEVPRGKPAPDVYLETARRLRVEPSRCAAAEDSANGIRSAVSSGMCVIVIPNHRYPPGADVLGTADLLLPNLDELSPEAVIRADGAHEFRIEERLDEQEIQSFPASDPHSDWAGPVEGRFAAARLRGLGESPPNT